MAGDTNSVIKFLGGREGEQKRIVLLLILGGCMGCFLATLQVPAETLITTYASQYLREAFLVSGGLGIFSAVLYVAAQRRLPFTTLSIINVSVIALLTMVLRGVFFFTDNTVSSFILFVMLGPLTSVMVLNFWGIYGRIFDVRASKRIIGGIDTGQLMATCLVFFAISFVSDYIDTRNILWMSVISSMGIVLVSSYIVLHYRLDRSLSSKLATVDSTGTTRQRKGISYLDIVRNKYFLMMALFLLFSVCAAKFNEYNYRMAMFAWYEGDEGALNKAYSRIDAFIIVLSFLIQSFFNDYIIGRYGLKVSLMVMPVLLGLFTVGAIVSGHLIGYERAVAGSNYFVFFSFNVMGRMLAASLRDALENPAFKMFFFPVDERDRFDLQSRVEGVVNEVAALSAGSMLLLMGAVQFFSLMEFAYLLLLFVAGAIFMSIKLFDQYKVALKGSLLKQKSKLQGQDIQTELSVSNIMSRGLKDPTTDVLMLTLKFAGRLEPHLFPRYLTHALQSSSPEVRAYAYDKCKEIAFYEAIDKLEQATNAETDEEARAKATEALTYLKTMKEQLPDAQASKKMLRDPDPETRRRLAQQLVLMSTGANSHYLIELLRDPNVAVRRAAIITAGRLRMPDFWPFLVGSLHIPAYTNEARSALISCGKAVFQTVDMFFYRTAQLPSTMFRVVQILGRIGGGEGMERIWKKLDYPSRRIFNECIFSLSCNSYRAGGVRGARIKLQIEEEVANITWNIQALIQIPKKHPVDKMLRQAIEEENMRNQESLFLVMAMVYDSKSVQLVRENVDFGTPESLTYAIELMNIFLDSDLKPKLFPIFEDLRPDEKVAKLSSAFAPERFKGYLDALLQIVNRDYNRLNRWTKSLAIYRLSSLNSAAITSDLLANVFNPDYSLVQVSFFVLLQKDRNEYRRQTLRLNAELAKRLDVDLLPPVELATDAKWTRPLLRVERVMFFKQCPVFAQIRGELLVELAELSHERTYKKDKEIVKLGDKGRDHPLRIILRGNVDRMNEQEEITGRLLKGDVIGLQSISPRDIYAQSYRSSTRITFLEIDKDELFSLLGMRVRLIEAFIKYAKEGTKRTKRTAQAHEKTECTEKRLERVELERDKGSEARAN